MWNLAYLMIYHLPPVFRLGEIAYINQCGQHKALPFRMLVSLKAQVGVMFDKSPKLYILEGLSVKTVSMPLLFFIYMFVFKTVLSSIFFFTSTLKNGNLFTASNRSSGRISFMDILELLS